MPFSKVVWHIHISVEVSFFFSSSGDDVLRIVSFDDD